MTAPATGRVLTVEELKVKRLTERSLFAASPISDTAIHYATALAEEKAAREAAEARVRELEGALGTIQRMEVVSDDEANRIILRGVVAVARNAISPTTTEAADAGRDRG